MTATQPAILAPLRSVPRKRFDRWDALALALLLAAFLALAAGYLPHASIWVDETTQMTALAMHPGELFTFLTGGHSPIGVPPDRAPPLSYWTGQLWATILGFSETSMRWCGVACTAAAIACVYCAARTFGRWPAIAAAGFLALSPNIINISVEIRSYPLFLLLAAASFWTFISLLQRDPLQPASPARARATPVLLTLLLITAMYTHFFGVMLAGAIMSAWVTDSLQRRRSLRTPFIAATALAAAAAGLYPFIHSASHVSGTTPAPSHFLVDALKFPAHLVTHSAMLLGSPGHLPLLLGLALSAAAVAFLAGLFRALTDPAARPILFAAAAGTAATLIAARVIHQFNPLATSYSIWLMPPLAILIGLSACEPGGILRKVAIAACLILLATSALGAIQLDLHGDQFAHGPQNQIFALIDHYGPANVTVIIDPDTPGDRDFSVLFPLRYRYHDSVQRYSAIAADPAHDGVLSYDDNEIVRASKTSNKNVDAHPLPAALTPYVIIIRCRNLPAQDLVAAIKNGPTPFGDGPAAAAFNHSSAYHKIESVFFTALLATDISIFQRNASDPPGSK